MRSRRPPVPVPQHGSAAGPGTGRLSRAVVTGALLVAALLRLIAFFQLRSLPNATSDGLFYQDVAQQLAGGTYLTTQPFNFSPLYVFFLAGIFKVCGPNLNVVRGVQLALGLPICGLLFLIARRLFGRDTAVVALVLAALYLPFIHFEGQLLSVTLTLFLMLLSLQLMLTADARGRPGLLVPAGAALGLGTLGAPLLLVLAAPAALWLGVLPRAAGANDAAPPTRARRLTGAAIFLGAVLLGVLPATLWNHRATGEFVLVSSQGGVNFFIGNNPDATGFFVAPKGMEDSLAGINLTGARRVAEREVGHPLTAAQVSRHWFRQGLDFVAAQPVDAARLWLRKAFLFANRYEVPLDLDQEAFQAYFPLLGWPLLSFGLVSLLGWMGALIAARRFRRHCLPLLLLATYALAVIAFFVSDRYRMPAVPLLILFGAFTITWARDRYRQKQAWPLLLAGGAGALAAVLVVFAPTGLQGAHASLSFNMATGFLQQQPKDLPRARAELEKCVAADPDWLEARYKLGLVDRELGDAIAALGAVDIVIARAPQNADAHHLRGLILLDKSLPNTAAREFSTALSLLPSHPDAAAKLAFAQRAAAAITAPVMRQRNANLNSEGWGFLDKHTYPPALANFAELLASGVDPAAREQALAGMGFAYASQNRLELALRSFEDAQAINPDDPVVQKNLALLYLKQQRPEKARPHVDRFAALSPNDPALGDLRAALAGRR